MRCHGACEVLGAVEHVLDRLGVRRPLLAVAPVLVGELPRLQRVVLAGLEAAQLLLVGDVHPELDQDRALGDQHASRTRGSRRRPAPTRRRSAKPSTRSTSTRPYQERSKTAMPPQPGSAGQNRHSQWCRFSSSVGAENGAHPHVARVELLDQPLDRAALAGGVPALEDDAAPAVRSRRRPSGRRAAGAAPAAGVCSSLSRFFASFFGRDTDRSSSSSRPTERLLPDRPSVGSLVIGGLLRTRSPRSRTARRPSRSSPARARCGSRRPARAGGRSRGSEARCRGRRGTPPARRTVQRRGSPHR